MERMRERLTKWIYESDTEGTRKGRPNWRWKNRVKKILVSWA